MTRKLAGESQRDKNILTEWNLQLIQAKRSPSLARLFSQSSYELFPRFVTCYEQLRALPRRARRALQRQLARSRHVEPIVEKKLRRHAGRSLQHTLAWSLAGAALLLALGQSVQAATIAVNTRKPEILADGLCSFPEAIINANDNAATHNDCAAGEVGPDTIQLPRGTQTLRESYGGGSGLPPVTSEITIEGNKAKIQRKKSADPFTLITVLASGDLILDQVTLSGGNSYSGGAIFNEGNLTLTNSVITKNSSTYGGGVYNAGTMTIQDSTISKNSATQRGGGVFNQGDALTIQNGTITKNTAEVSGGGIADFGANTNIEDSVLSKNEAALGGGAIANNGSLFTLVDSMITGNKAQNKFGVNASGGGASNYFGATLVIHNSVISKNTVKANPVANGGCIVNNGTLNIYYSTIEKCKADQGGGVLNNGGSALIAYSTISDNQAKTGVFDDSYGGGILNRSDLVLMNSTISGNKADIGGGIANAGLGVGYLSRTTITKNKSKELGGGIYNDGALYLDLNLISGNKTRASGFGPEVFNYGSLVANSYNLFGSNGDSGSFNVGGGGSDIVPGPGETVNKILSSSLRNNGGPTKTHALKSGSPAVDAMPALDPSCTGLDQRGEARPQGSGCDVGAFEL